MNKTSFLRGKTPNMLWVEKTYNKEIRVLLWEWYWHRRLSLSDIAQLVNLKSHVSILKWFRRLGIPRRTNSEAHRGKYNPAFDKSYSKYRVDLAFFKKWTRKMAYVLGFIYADGSLYSQDNHHTLEISQKDPEILKMIRKLLNSNHPITPNLRVYRLRINCKAIYKDLLTIGLTSRKSLSITFPRRLPREFFWDFVRGYLDGDGSICYRKHKVKGRWYVDLYLKIVGSDQFIRSLDSYIADKTNIKACLGRIGKVSVIIYQNKKAKFVLDRIYHNISNIPFLLRKYRMYSGFEEYKIKNESRPIYQRERWWG